ncbi:uncharacterized protein LOC118143666 [Callithrix jacchus]
MNCRVRADLPTMMTLCKVTEFCPLGLFAAILCLSFHQRIRKNLRWEPVSCPEGSGSHGCVVPAGGYWALRRRSLTLAAELAGGGKRRRKRATRMKTTNQISGRAGRSTMASLAWLRVGAGFYLVL